MYIHGGMQLLLEQCRSCRKTSRDYRSETEVISVIRNLKVEAQDNAMQSDMQLI